MDYTKTCQGWIYCITNKINGKRYIGQTINWGTRLNEHLKYYYTEKSALHSAIIKYGVSNFEMLPVVSFTAINRKVCLDVLNWLEIFYIKKYQTLTHQKGYNISEGGKCNPGVHPTEEVRKKLSEKKKTKEAIEQALKNKPDNRRKVLMYDLTGKFEREFNSITNAITYFGKDPKITSGFYAALKDSHHHYCNHLWRYKEDSNFPIFIEPYNDNRGRTVYYYTKDRQLIASYPSAIEASEQTGVCVRTINNSLEGEQKGRKRRSNYWSHIPPEMQVSVC